MDWNTSNRISNSGMKIDEFAKIIVFFDWDESLHGKCAE
jgi:hypothetical protein